MENHLEKVLQFEGQDIKVITDKGVEMFKCKSHSSRYFYLLIP